MAASPQQVEAPLAECDNAQRRDDDSVHPLHAPPRQHRKRATSAAVRRAPSPLLHPPPATPRASIVCVCVCVCAWCFV